jgi:hypothetical protein
MKKVIIILITYILLLNGNTFIRIFGSTNIDHVECVKQTTDNGFILAGYTNSYGAGIYDIWLIKTDSNGDKVWDKTYGGVKTELGYSVSQTTDDGFILTGSTESFSVGIYDVWLVKTDSLGNQEWSNTFGDVEYDKGYSVHQTSDGGYILTGITGNTSDVWLIKTDSNGNELWNKTYGDTELIESGNCIVQTADSGYIITGSVSDIDNTSLLLLKFDMNGNVEWNRVFGGIDSDIGYSVQQTPEGSYIIVGSTRSYGAGLSDVWLIKTDSNGEKVWDKTFGGSSNEGGREVQQTVDGDYIIIGSTESFGNGEHDIWLIKTDSDGNLLWSNTYGGSSIEYGESTQQTIDGGYIIAGNTESYGAGEQDIWLIKTDEYGNTAIDSNPSGLIGKFELNQNYPNPFNPETTISYTLKNSATVNLKVYDISGKEMMNLIESKQKKGFHEMKFDGSNLASGIYFYQLLLDNKVVESKKMMLLK